MKDFKVSPRKAEHLKPNLFVRMIEGLRKTGAVTSRKGYFFMQDGAIPHFTNVALQFFKEKFRERVIH